MVQLTLMVVPMAGLEPARMLLRGILSPLRLPISPHRHKIPMLRRNSAFPQRDFALTRNIGNFKAQNRLIQSCALLEAPPRFGLGVELLQSSALPLGYGAVRVFYILSK